jgi:hypothetical protein
MAKKSDKKDKKKAPAVKKKAAKPAAKAAVKKMAAKKAAPAKAAAKKAAPAPAKKKVAAPPPAAKKAAAKAAPAPAAKPVGKGKAPIPPAKAKKGAKETEARQAKEAPVEETAADGAEEEAPEEVVLTDAEGRRYCRVKDCDQLSTVDGYCRYHYLLYWKKIQIRKKILSEGKLERYVEELTARYPDKFLEMLRKDLRSEKEFLAAIQELEIDESAVDNELEDETQTYIDEVRGLGEATGAREEEDF